MRIVIVDSGVSERFECERIDFSRSGNSISAPARSGHGTAVYGIIRKKCSSFAEIVNIRLEDIEDGVDTDSLCNVLEYVNNNVHPDILNLIIDFFSK